MDTPNYTYKGKTWNPCPTTSGNNSFFHSAFGVRASTDEKYFDRDAKFRRMRWATFLTYFENRTIPPPLADVLRKCLSASDKHKRLSVEDKGDFGIYAWDIIADEKIVTKEEIPILATLGNITITILSDGRTDAAVTVRPNPEILGGYRIVLEKPQEVVLCLKENIFSRLEPVKEKSKPKSNKNKAEKKTDPSRYKKGGSAGSKGVEYQISLIALVMLNSLKNGLNRWRLSTENEEAGKFDDVVLECPTGDVLIQSKHKENKSRISLEDLISTNSKSDDFSLPKYFLSYQLIKSKFKIKHIVLCTNADVHEKVLKFLDRQKPPTEGVLHCEEGSYSLYTLNEKLLPDLKDNAKTYYLQNSKNKDVEESEIITDDNLKDFLKHLQLYFNYPPRTQLENAIDKLLSVVRCCGGTRDKTFPPEIYPKVMEWFQSRDGTYLTEVHAKAIFSEIWRDKRCQKLEQYEVAFQENELNFQAPKQIFHVTSTGECLLQEIKIYRVLQSEKMKILFLNLDDGIEVQSQVVEAFGLPQYTFLIMIWPRTTEDSVMAEVFSKLKVTLEERKYKKIILVAESDAKPAQQIGLEEPLRLDGCVTFEHLSEESTERLSKSKNVDFQGEMVSLEELFVSRNIEDYKKYVNSEILEKLVRGVGVRVGVRPSSLDEDTAWYYISRRFVKESTDEDGSGNNERREVLSEENIYNVDEKIILIGDGAGMGKSTVLTKLAAIIKEKHPHLWVIRINLNDYTKLLKDSQDGNVKTVSAVELLNSQEATKLTSDFEEYVFFTDERVVLMLDGVDEVSPNYTYLILDLLGQCRQASNFAKIIVTTRPHVTQQIESALKVGRFRMLPFTKDDQVDFLQKYWTRNLRIDDTEKKKCERYAKTLLAKVSTWTRSDQYKENPFAAIPLQVRMLADIFQENVKNESVNWQGCRDYLMGDESEPKLPEKFDVAILYGVFIEKKRDSFVDKGNSSGNTVASRALVDKFDECLNYHRRLALETILSKMESDLFSNCQQSNKNVELYVLKIGMVHKSEDRPQFAHRTFAEYFVAQSIARELEVQATNPSLEFQKLVIEEILIREEYKVVRSFLDGLLQSVVDRLPFTAFENYQASSYENGLSYMPVYRNIIFVLSKEGYVPILQLVLKTLNNDSWRTKSGQTINIFKTFSTFFELLSVKPASVINIRDGADNTPLHLAARAGHLEMVKFLVDQGADIHSRNRVGRTALHAAARSGDLDVIRYLLEHGADVNVRDAAGCTALHVAEECGNAGVVEYFVEPGVDVSVELDV